MVRRIWKGGYTGDAVLADCSSHLACNDMAFFATQDSRQKALSGVPAKTRKAEFRYIKSACSFRSSDVFSSETFLIYFTIKSLLVSICTTWSTIKNSLLCHKHVVSITWLIGTSQQTRSVHYVAYWNVTTDTYYVLPSFVNTACGCLRKQMAGAWSWPLASIWCKSLEKLKVYTRFPMACEGTAIAIILFVNTFNVQNRAISVPVNVLAEF
jgi:hypothetical protein